MQYSSSSLSTRDELQKYVNDMLGGKDEEITLDYEQVKNLINHLCSRMGIHQHWTEAYGKYLTDEAFSNFQPQDKDSGLQVMRREGVDMLLDDMMRRPLMEARHSKKCVVLGGGAYGTAITTVLARKGHRVTIVMQNAEQEIVDAINKTHRNPSCFPDIPLHPFLVTAVTESQLGKVMEDAEFIMLAIPVQFISSYLTKHKEHFAGSAPITCVSKGIDAKTNRFMSEIIPEVLPHSRLAYLAGPSFAIEMMQDAPTMVTVASNDAKLARSVQVLFSSPLFRVFTTDDVYGVEVGSALKNVLAIACGVLAGLGYGPNTQMAMVTRGWADIRTLSKDYGAREETMTGLAGIGDVMLTCFGGFSRNSKFGNCLAKCGDVEQALAEVNSTVEGYFTSFSIKKIARDRGLRLPTLVAISDMLSGRISPSLLAPHVMGLPLSQEEERTTPAAAAAAAEGPTSKL